MSCEKYKELLMGYLDNELDNEQKQEVEKHLARCQECSEELQGFKQLKVITDNVKLAEPDDKLWQQYWNCIYNRIERIAGWLVFSAAAVLVLIYAGFKGIEKLLLDPAVDTILKIGLLGLIAGLAILLVSAARERLYFWKKDRYKDIRR